MNKRQKKKLFKQTLIKVRKLHPQKNDVICFQPDLDWIDAETMCQFMKVYSNNDVFGESKDEFDELYRNVYKLLRKQSELV